jgi:menaquinone reductase, iron-sulfur cluster-binding subunit
MPKWGMVIDVDKCTGCGDCVAACKLENNVPVVTPEQADEGREMFWMDILTTFEGDYPNHRAHRAPRLCFHCDNPPCTRVCPVHATYLNEEGLVGQVYHRCIGCRYCMAACPYTAKVFNWFEPDWEPERQATHNPDVSLRMNGVVEKCSFCSHRWIMAREQAALDKREILDGEYMPACAESCPADAISFGDLDNKDSRVYGLSNSSRANRVMEDLGTEPKVYYLSKKE